MAIASWPLILGSTGCQPVAFGRRAECTCNAPSRPEVRIHGKLRRTTGWQPVRPREELDCNRRFDRWMRIVADELEVFELEIVNVFDRRIQFHLRQRST